MSIRIYLDDQSRPYAEAESATEAVEVMKLWGGASKNGDSPSGQPRLFDEPTAVAEMLAEIPDRPKKILRALLEFPSGTDAVKIAEATREPTSAFGGLLGSVSKQAAKVKLRSEQIFISEMKGSGPKRFRFMQPGKLLLKYADQVTSSVGLGGWKSDLRRKIAEEA